MNSSKRHKQKKSSLPLPSAATTASDKASLKIVMDSMRIFCIYLVALAWPLGAYQRVVGPIHIHHLAVLPLFLESLFHLKRHYRLQTPFELFWPCALLALAATGIAVSTKEAFWFVIPCQCILFTLIYHSIRDRETIWRALHLSVFSGAIMLFLSVFARLNWIFPTVFSPESRLVMAGPYAIGEGLLTSGILLLALLLLAGASLTSEYPRRWSVMGACILFMVSISLFTCIPLWKHLSLWHPAHDLFIFPAVILALFAFWGCARIAAKLIVAATHIPLRLALLLAVSIILGTCLTMASNRIPSFGCVFLLALLSAYGKPQLYANVIRWRPFVLVLPLTIVVVINLVFMLPGDPRNYEATAIRALAQNDFARLRTELAFVKELAPAEHRAEYYIARSYLEEGDIFLAAQSFSRAIRRTGRPRLLPPPNERDIEFFLNQMRDFTSTFPERLRGLAYEQSLIAAGRERHALSLLELRGEANLWEGMSRAPLAAALAAALNAPQLITTLAEWDAGLLATILESAGPLTELCAAPPGFPEEQLPCIVVMAQDAQSLDVQVFTPAGNAGGITGRSGLSPEISDAARLALETNWDLWRLCSGGGWQLDFGSWLQIHVGTTLEVRFPAKEALPRDYPLSGGEIRIYVPPRLLSHE